MKLKKKAGEICEEAQIAVKSGNCVWRHCDDDGDLRDSVLQAERAAGTGQRVH